MRTPFAPLTVVAIFLWAGTSSAQSVCDSPEQQAALELRRVGRDAEAAAAFQAIYARTRQPCALARLALAEMQLGRWAESFSHLNAAVSQRLDPWIHDNRDRIEEQIEVIRGHVGRLNVVGAPRGAQLSVDHRPAGALPLSEPVYVERGARTVEVTLGGHRIWTTTVEITGGATIDRVDVPSQRDSIVEPPPEAPPPGPVMQEPLVQTTAVTPSSSSALRPVGVALLAVGAVSAGVGGILLGLREGSVDAFNSDPRCWVDGETVRGGPNCNDAYQEGNTLNTAAVATFVAGGVLAVTGVVMLITAPSSAPSTERVSVRCSPWLTGVGAGCEGRF